MMIARRTLLAVYGAMTIFAGLVPGDVHAQEKWRGRLPRGTAAPLRPQPTPMLAVVGLREQRIRIYELDRRTHAGISRFQRVGWL